MLLIQHNQVPQPHAPKQSPNSREGAQLVDRKWRLLHNLCNPFWPSNLGLLERPFKRLRPEKEEDEQSKFYPPTGRSSPLARGPGPGSPGRRVRTRAAQSNSPSERSRWCPASRLVELAPIAELKEVPFEEFKPIVGLHAIILPTTE